MKSAAKPATIYLEPEVEKALRAKSVATERSLSDLVNEAVKLELAEDAEDLAAFSERSGEPNVALEEVVADLRRRGKL